MRYVIAIAFVMGLMSIPVDAQRTFAQRNRIEPWIGIPISLYSQVAIEEIDNGQILNQLGNIDLNITTQIMFPVTDVISIGPEIGISYPPTSIGIAIEEQSVQRLADRFRIPLLFVTDFVLSESGLLHIQLFTGTRFNIWNTQGEFLKTLTVELGARISIAGVFVEVGYSLPFSLNLDQVASVRTTPSTVRAWDNNLTLGAGYIIFL